MVVGSLIPNCYCKLIVCRFKFAGWYRIVVCALPYTCTGHVYASSNRQFYRKIVWNFWRMHGQCIPSSLFPLPPKKKREPRIVAEYLAN